MAPGELLHLDVTIIKLLDGTRTYLHAVIDNFSRRILSWALEDRLGSGATCRVLQEAASQISADTRAPIVVADSGSENVNEAFDESLDGEELTRVLAQVEITFSNSMIEAFWRSLKHSWLYLHSLESFAALRRLIEFYVTAHNEVMPHSAFQGQTPDDVFFGIGDEVAKRRSEARDSAREERMRRIGPRDAAYASERRLRGRCYCNGRAPECCKTQRGSTLGRGQRTSR